MTRGTSWHSSFNSIDFSFRIGICIILQTMTECRLVWLRSVALNAKTEPFKSWVYVRLHGWCDIAQNVILYSEKYLVHSKRTVVLWRKFQMRKWMRRNNNKKNPMWTSEHRWSNYFIGFYWNYGIWHFEWVSGFGGLECSVSIILWRKM